MHKNSFIESPYQLWLVGKVNNPFKIADFLQMVYKSFDYFC